MFIILFKLKIYKIILIKVLNEMERNLQDVLAVARNIMVNPMLVPGGGATEMEISHRLNEKAKSVQGLEQLPLRAGNNSIVIIFKKIKK